MSSASAGGRPSAASSARGTHRMSWPSQWPGTPDQAAAVEVQGECPVRIGVGRREHELADVDVRAEFFADLPPERGGVALLRIDLATWEFPHPGEMSARLPLCQEEAVVLFDDRGDDRGHERPAGAPSALAARGGYERHMAVIGHTAHFGCRATHTSAPRSISA